MVGPLLAAALALSTSGTSVRVEAVTDVPLHVGAAVRAELPARVRVGASLGVLPGPYVDLINSVAVEAGAYDEDTARLIRKSLTRSLVARATAGWRPFAHRGFYVEGGYTWISLGGNVAGEDLITLATGVEPPGALAGDREYDVQSTLHLAGAEAGWEWRLRARPIVLRTSIGFATTIAAQSTVEPRYDPLAPALVERFTDETEDYLDETYRRYVHLPVLALSASWAF